MATSTDVSRLRLYVGQLLDLLDEEFRLLSSASLAELHVLLERKRALIEQVDDAASPDFVRLMEDLDEDAVDTDLQALVDLVRDCWHRNRVNGTTLRELVHMRRAALGALIGHEQTAEARAYLPDGMEDAKQGRRILGRA